MLILKPYPHITIWGGERLAKYLNEDISSIGHLYTVRGNESDSNQILNNVGGQTTLYEYFCKNKKRWGLEMYEEFPISVALVDAKSNLSVQVHPTSEIATVYESKGVGKNESFYIIEEPEDKKMINGCKCNSKEQLIQCVEESAWEEVIDYLDVEKGDYVYVTAGMLHAMTKGALTYEIEENCNYTYRLYDYDRVDENGNKRELDVEKSIASIDVSKKSITQKYTQEEIVEEKYATKMIENVAEYVNMTKNIECITFIEVNGYVENIQISAGMSILLEPGENLAEINISKAIVARIL